jgi:hypothetical protein
MSKDFRRFHFQYSSFWFFVSQSPVIGNGDTMAETGRKVKYYFQLFLGGLIFLSGEAILSAAFRRVAATSAEYSLFVSEWRMLWHSACRSCRCSADSLPTIRRASGSRVVRARCFRWLIAGLIVE